MRSKFIVSDSYGLLMRVLLCCIIWYKEVIQNKFFQGSNVFLILGSILSIVIILDYLSNGKRILIVNKYAFGYFMYLILTFVLGFFSSHRINDHITYGITVIEFSVIMLFVCYYASTRGNIDFLIWNFVFVYSFMMIVFLVNPTKLTIGGVIRYSYSSGTNPNSFAIGMTIGIWAILYLIANKKIKLLIGLPICGFMLYSIFMTGARKGFFAALICFAFWFLLFYIPLNEKRSLVNKIGKIVLAIVIVVVMAYILFPLFSESSVASRLLSRGLDESSSVRTDMYKVGFDYLNDSPIVGHGFWGFAYFYGAYSHSTWVEAFVSSGYILGLAMVLIYFCIGKSLVKSYRQSKLIYEKKRMISQFLVLFITLLSYSFVTIHFYNLCVMICIGMIVSSINSCDQNNMFAVRI